MSKKRNNKTRNFMLALATSTTVLCWSAQGWADVNSSMNAYWSSSIGSANVTGPTAYQGQSAGYYTGGNVAFRGPQETSQIASIQMPSVRAGCGGIDIFSGGFSFINSDQIVAQLKAVASNALSYAFMLALKTLSPIVADQMESLQNIANEVNQFNMNSCQQAQALVGGLWGRSDTASNQICQDLGTYRGFFSDRIAARHDCPNRLKQTLDRLPDEDKAVIPINKNIAWEAAKQHPVISADKDTAQLFMTLTGTIIYRCPDDEGCVVDVLPAQAAEDGVITKLLDGGPLRVHRCDELENCLNPQKFGAVQTVATNAALRSRVEGMLREITRKIQARQALTTTEQDFLNMVSLPVYKMASVFVAHEGPLAGNTMAQYSEVIALDMTITWLERSVMQLENGARNLQGVDETQLRDWRNSINQVREHLRQRQMLVKQSSTAIEAMIARAQSAERVVAARVSSRVADSVTFSSSLVPN